MKNISSLLFVISFCLLAVLSGCMFQKNDKNIMSSESIQATPKYISEWPDNEYTKNISKPQNGKMDYMIDDSANGHFSVFLKKMAISDSNDYIDSLKSQGYTEVQSSKNNVSAGTVLSKDNVTLNIAYSEGIVGITITIKQ